MKVPKPEELEKAKAALRGNLKDDLLSEARKEIPKDFVLFNNAYFVEFESEPAKNAENNSIEITENAIFRGFIFDKSHIFEYIAKESTSKYDGSSVEILKAEDIEFNAVGGVNNAWSKDEIIFTLEGDTTVVWTYDENEIEESILGKSLEEINEIMSTYPAVSKSEIIIKPFWKKTLPQEPKKVKIVKKDE